MILVSLAASSILKASNMRNPLLIAKDKSRDAQLADAFLPEFYIREPWSFPSVSNLVNQSNRNPSIEIQKSLH